MIRLLLAAILSATLSAGSTELMPNATTSITATLYGDGAHVVRLQAPPGFVVEQPERQVTLDGQYGVLINWAVHPSTVQPSLTPYTIVLRVDGAVMDSIGVRICCVRWPDAKAEHRLYLPMLWR